VNFEEADNLKAGGGQQLRRTKLTNMGEEAEVEEVEGGVEGEVAVQEEVVGHLGAVEERMEKV